MLSHVDTIPQRDRQTDGQTDRISVSMSCVSIAVLTRDNKYKMAFGLHVRD